MGIFHGDAPYKLGILIAMLNCNCTQWLKLTRSPTNRPCHELGIGCDDFPMKIGDSQGLCWGDGIFCLSLGVPCSMLFHDPVLFHVVSMTFDKALWIEGFKIVSVLAERAQQHNTEIWEVGGCTCQSRRWFHRPSTVSVHRFKATTTNESKLVWGRYTISIHPNKTGVGNCPILGILDITWKSSHLVDHIPIMVGWCPMGTFNDPW